MNRLLILCLFLIALCLPLAAAADDLTQMAQQDLVTLGYDPGEVNGEASTKTIVAISKFQAEHDMDVTGEVTPQLVGALRAAISKQGAASSDTAAAQAAPAQRTEAELQAAQQACLMEKYEAAQASQKKKRGFGKLLSAISRTSSQFGSGGVAGGIAQTAGAVYGVNATADDLKGAAEDLGLTEEEVEECRNPQ